MGQGRGGATATNGSFAREEHHGATPTACKTPVWCQRQGGHGAIPADCRNTPTRSVLGSTQKRPKSAVMSAPTGSSSLFESPHQQNPSRNPRSKRGSDVRPNDLHTHTHRLRVPPGTPPRTISGSACLDAAARSPQPHPAAPAKITWVCRESDALHHTIPRFETSSTPPMAEPPSAPKPSRISLRATITNTAIVAHGQRPTRSTWEKSVPAAGTPHCDPCDSYGYIPLNKIQAFFGKYPHGLRHFELRTNRMLYRKTPHVSKASRTLKGQRERALLQIHIGACCDEESRPVQAARSSSATPVPSSQQASPTAWRPTAQPLRSWGRNALN